MKSLSGVQAFISYDDTPGEAGRTTGRLSAIWRKE